MFRAYIEWEKSNRSNRKFDYITEDVEESLKNFLTYHKCYPHLRRIYESIQQCDAVVFNGEGDFIFTNPPKKKPYILFDDY